MAMKSLSDRLRTTSRHEDSIPVLKKSEPLSTFTIGPGVTIIVIASPGSTSSSPSGFRSLLEMVNGRISVIRSISNDGTKGSLLRISTGSSTEISITGSRNISQLISCRDKRVKGGSGTRRISFDGRNISEISSEVFPLLEISNWTETVSPVVTTGNERDPCKTEISGRFGIICPISFL